MTFLKLTISLFALSPGARRHQTFDTRLFSTTETTQQQLPVLHKSMPISSIGLQVKVLKLTVRLPFKNRRRGGGYGAVVTESVPNDELLFTIPRKACVTMQNVCNDISCGDAFTRTCEKGRTRSKHCLYGWISSQGISHDARIRYRRRFLLSTILFGPYLATLPWERGVNNQEHTLYWSDEDIELLLKGSLSYQEANDLRDEVKLAATVMEGIVGPSIREYRGETVSSSAEFSWPWEKKQPQEPVDGLSKTLTGAFVSVLSRSFQDGQSGDEEKLVPLLDMLQHSDEPNVRHAMRKVDGTVEVRARRDLTAGEELLNQYRSEAEEKMPYHRFFTRYGFVPGITEPIPNLLRDKSPIFFAQKAEV